MLLATVVTIDDYWLTMLLSVFLPMVVALITKQVASGAVKSVILLALSVLTSALTTVQANGGSFDLQNFIVGTVMSFVIAVGVHFGLLKPSKVTGAEGAIQRKTSGFGAG